MQTLIVTESAALVSALAPYTTSGRRSTKVAVVARFHDPDQQAILVLLQKGWSCRAIAAELGVCVPTVKARLRLLYRQSGRHRQPTRT